MVDGDDIQKAAAFPEDGSRVSTSLFDSIGKDGRFLCAHC